MVSRQMLPFLKSKLSRTVHHYHNNNNQKNIINEEASISLTVWRKSLLFTCSGFTVIAPDGSLAYRVDNYTRRPHRIVLMDGLGNPIFTICRPKKLNLVDNYWLVYEGDQAGKLLHSGNLKPEPVLCARKNIMNILQAAKGNVLAHVYCGASGNYKRRRRRCLYMVEGSYSRRSCKILDESRRVVGEIKKKGGSTSGASFGLDVFELVVREGLESRFGMAIVLLLDQIDFQIF